MSRINRILRRRPSPAMVVALIALFVAMGGTGYAIKRLPRNSVGSKQIRKKAVQSKHIRSRNVTRTKIATKAITSELVGTDAILGSNILESSLGTVPKATDATNATNATSATKVNGLNVQKMFFRAAAGTPGTTVLNLNGLVLTAACNAGTALSVTATTATSGAIIHSGGTFTASAAYYTSDNAFNTGTTFDILLNGTTGSDDLRGTLTYAAADGNLVTANYLAEETGGNCNFVGTAVG